VPALQTPDPVNRRDFPHGIFFFNPELNTLKFQVSMSSRPASYYKINCVVLPFVTAIFCLLSWISFSMYEVYFNITWFHIGYVLIAAGILVGIWATFPQFIKRMQLPVTRHSYGFFNSVITLTGFMSMSFVFALFCDQWLQPQPFTGESIVLIIYSTVIMLMSALANFIIMQYRKKGHLPSLPKIRIMHQHPEHGTMVHHSESNVYSDYL
jgi:hypothetical protein